jgi:ubiquitin-protein ligase
MAVWWPRLLKDKKRLVAEVRAMEERYGGLATLRFQNRVLYWEYTVVESGRRFPIHVPYPRRYPFEPPRIISLLGLPPSPHQLSGNELCWTNRIYQSEWNPARDTAAVCIHAAHRWFACLLVFLTLGHWPAEADDYIRILE